MTKLFHHGDTWFPPEQRERIALLRGSLTDRDARLAGYPPTRRAVPRAR